MQRIDAGLVRASVPPFAGADKRPTPGSQGVIARVTPAFAHGRGLSGCHNFASHLRGVRLGPAHLSVTVRSMQARACDAAPAAG